LLRYLGHRLIFVFNAGILIHSSIYMQTHIFEPAMRGKSKPNLDEIEEQVVQWLGMNMMSTKNI